MLRAAVIVVGFLIGEILFYLIVREVRERLFRSGAISPSPAAERFLTIGALLLPLFYAAIALIGVFFLLNRSLPPTAASQNGEGQEATSLATLPPHDPEEEEDGGETLPEQTEAPLPTSKAPVDLPDLPDPPTGKIVYTCQIFKTGLRDQICLINADGSGYIRLTTNDDGDYNFPSLSPDGERVIYAGKEPGEDFEIYEISIDGESQPVQLTFGGGTASGPEISPDESQIVFNRIANGINTIWVMDRDGSNQRQVFGAPQGAGWDPVWSPDGSRILFASDRMGSIQFYSIALDGTDLQRVTNLPGLRGRSDWSSQGFIATYMGGPWEHEIVVMGEDGSNPRQITGGGNNLSPSYSPDGEWIAFTSYRDIMRDELGCEIYIMRIDGTQLTRLTINDYCDWQPRWGP